MVTFALAATVLAALSQDKDVASCAAEAGQTARAYAKKAFAVHEVRLRSGERMTVALATDFCLMRGQSARILIFEHTGAGYRRVLDEVTMPDASDVTDDGTVTLPTHDTMETIFEATYVWNGNMYAFSPLRSHMYDVPLEQRRPYEVPVRFAPGAYETTLSGTFTYNFGQDYVFAARAGQRITLELATHAKKPPAVLLYIREQEVADLIRVNRWSGMLPKTGTYRLTVYGTDATPDVFPYSIRLEIR